MNKLPIGALLAVAMLGAVSAPIAVQAQRAEFRGPASPDLPPQMPGRMAPGLGLAAHLAALQIYLGVTDAQQPVWQDYCRALIAFVEPDLPEPAAKPEGLMAERMARDAMARAVRAQALLDAITALRGALDPAQMQRLQRSDPGFGPQVIRAMPPALPGPTNHE